LGYTPSDIALWNAKVWLTWCEVLRDSGIDIAELLVSRMKPDISMEGSLGQLIVIWRLWAYMKRIQTRDKTTTMGMR
jgi:hypothetical protein